MIRIMIGMLPAFQLGEVLRGARFGGGLLRQEVHVLEPGNPAFNANLLGEGADAGGLVEGPDGELEIIVAVLAHVEGSSAFGAEAPRHYGR